MGNNDAATVSYGAASAMPTHEDMVSFRPDAEHFAQALGMQLDHGEKWDALVQNCETLALPCLATVGKCMLSSYHEPEAGAEGEATFDESGCACLAAGATDHIVVPKHPDLELTCSLSCLVEINGVINRKMETINGESGDRAECGAVLEEINQDQFGNGRGYIHTESEDDGSTFYQPTNEKVVKSADAAVAYINIQRQAHCPAMTLYEGAVPTVDMATGNLVEAGHHEFSMEFTLPDNTQWAARVSHKGNDEYGLEETADQHALDDYDVMSISPEPCATGPSAKLANTHKKAREINLKQLPWKAEYDIKKHFGQTLADLHAKTGLVISEETKKASQLSTVLDATGFQPPAEYDARDYWPNDGPCQIATNIQNQKQCGSCYAFAASAALSYRLCMDRAAGWNMVLNPQELMDCSGSGCQGGDPLNTMQKATVHPSENDWCEPYISKVETCGTSCPNGQDVYTVGYEPDLSTGKVARWNPDNYQGQALQDKIDETVLLFQKELFENGPFPIGFECYDDFFAYKSGVYTASSTTGTSQHASGHAVVLIGWGEENGVPYWLIQNSWGPNTGDRQDPKAGPGVYKFKRGSNEATIESFGGYFMKVKLHFRLLAALPRDTALILIPKHRSRVPRP